jgi:hypothetical protein
MVPRGDAEARVAVDDARVLCGDRDVGEQPGHEPRAHRRAVHRRHHHLGTIDDVVDEVPRLAPDARARLEILRDPLHHRQVAAGGKSLARAAQDGDARLGIAVDVEPDLRQLLVQLRGGGGELAALLAHHEFEDAGLEPANFQVLVSGVVHGGILQSGDAHP